MFDFGMRKLWRSMLTHYFHWRYWNHVVKSVKHIDQSSCKSETDPLHHPGIVISLDDSFRVNHWYKYGKEIFDKNDIKVTLNINAYHHFDGQREHSQEEIDQLIELQSDGHEIAHHGFKHKEAVKYSREYGFDRWIKDDIIPLFEWMDRQKHSKTKEKFIRPVTYAFPHFRYNEELVNKIIPKYFKVARGHNDQDYHTPFNHEGFAPSICIDMKLLKKAGYIKKILKAAKKSKKNIIFTCHSILPNDIEWNSFNWGSESEKAGLFRVSPKTVELIIKEANKHKMAFYTTAELAGIAMFPDPNLEKGIRKYIKVPNAKWISIDELRSIKEMDLSGLGIKNLYGIQYFKNLEYLNLSHNQIMDIQVLKKLPKLKQVHLSHNSRNIYKKWMFYCIHPIQLLYQVIDNYCNVFELIN